MQTKRKGTRNEHRSIELLETMGYRCTRAAASLGVWDIVGIGPKDIVLCQVKSNRWPGSVEMKGLQDFQAPRNCHKLIHRWCDRQLEPDVVEL
jgi:Holliday junction resolvase